MQLITTDHELQAFRERYLSAETLLQFAAQLNSSKAGLVDPSVGVGKSYSIDSLTVEAIASGQHDLVMVLAPRHDILQERAPLQRPEEYNITTAHLVSRPAQLCGSARAGQWRIFERQQLWMLGRKTICSACPERESCTWLNQLGRSLQGIQVVYAPQAYLTAIPSFIQLIQNSTGAKRPLVLFDEVDFAIQTHKKMITHQDLTTQRELVRELLVETDKIHHEKLKLYLYYLECLISAKQDDISGEWDIPILPQSIHEEIQQLGYNKLHEKYSFSGFKIELLRYSMPQSRQVNNDGSIEYLCKPMLGDRSIIFSGSAKEDILKHRLGVDIETQFSEYVFFHKGTKWYNISSKTGMDVYFKKNSDQILFFFAQLTLKLLDDNKKPVFVCKKSYKNEIISKTNNIFLSSLASNYRLITFDEYLKLNENEKHTFFPVIHYGMIGINTLKDFDAALCANGYYIPTEAASSLLQEQYNGRHILDFKICTDGIPKRRKVIANRDQDNIYKEHLNLAQSALEQLELSAVMQAVGRIRPLTSPCTVVTFQCGQLPGVVYEEEFSSIGEAREYFGLLSQREYNTKELFVKIQSLKSQGYTQAQISEHLRISKRNVQRYWKNK